MGEKLGSTRPGSAGPAASAAATYYEEDDGTSATGRMRSNTLELAEFLRSTGPLDPHPRRSDTLELAEFLKSTAPEDYQRYISPQRDSREKAEPLGKFSSLFKNRGTHKPKSQESSSRRSQLPPFIKPHRTQDGNPYLAIQVDYPQPPSRGHQHREHVEETRTRRHVHRQAQQQVRQSNHAAGDVNEEGGSARNYAASIRKVAYPRNDRELDYYLDSLLSGKGERPPERSSPNYTHISTAPLPHHSYRDEYGRTQSYWSQGRSSDSGSYLSDATNDTEVILLSRPGKPPSYNSNASKYDSRYQTHPTAGPGPPPKTNLPAAPANYGYYPNVRREPRQEGFRGRAEDRMQSIGRGTSTSTQESTTTMASRILEEPDSPEEIRERERRLRERRVRDMAYAAHISPPIQSPQPDAFFSRRLSTPDARYQVSSKQRLDEEMRALASDVVSRGPHSRQMSKESPSSTDIPCSSSQDLGISIAPEATAIKHTSYGKSQRYQSQEQTGSQYGSSSNHPNLYRATQEHADSNVEDVSPVSPDAQKSAQQAVSHQGSVDLSAETNAQQETPRNKTADPKSELDALRSKNELLEKALLAILEKKEHGQDTSQLEGSVAALQ